MCACPLKVCAVKACPLAEALLSGWRAPAMILAAAVGILGGAMVLQHGFGIEPCALCVWQRWPYLAEALLAAGALAVRGWPRVALLGLIGLAALANLGIATFHVGVEQHWWTATPGCGVPAPATTIEELRAQLMATPVARCDQVPWSLFGISLAGYNIVLSLGLAGFALLAARRVICNGGRPDAP
jgi:disulfide bond formation protein DsbB